MQTGHDGTLKYIEHRLNRSDAYDITSQYFAAYSYTILGNTSVLIDGAVPDISTPRVNCPCIQKRYLA